MPRAIGKRNSYINGPSGIPVHPLITDTRTLAQALNDHASGIRSAPPTPVRQASDQAKRVESAFPELSTQDSRSVHCAQCYVKCITECPQ
jgi:hypothetical protein